MKTHIESHRLIKKNNVVSLFAILAPSRQLLEVWVSSQKHHKTVLPSSVTIATGSLTRLWSPWLRGTKGSYWLKAVLRLQRRGDCVGCHEVRDLEVSSGSLGQEDSRTLPSLAGRADSGSGLFQIPKQFFRCLMFLDQCILAYFGATHLISCRE